MVQSTAQTEGVDVLVLTQVGSDVSIPTAGLETHIHTHTHCAANNSGDVAKAREMEA